MLLYDFTNAINLLPGIIKAINIEIGSCVYYMSLIELAPGKTEKNLIGIMVEEDILGCNLYRDIYEKLTGCPPVIASPGAPEIEDFEMGISAAFLEEIKAYRFYKDMYVRVTDESIRKALFSSMTDKGSHSLNLLFMGAYSGGYTKNT